MGSIPSICPDLHSDKFPHLRSQTKHPFLKGDAYISLTDIAKYKNPDNAFIVVANWMRNHSTISFLGLWEQIHNPNFKPIEFDRFKTASGDNAFTLTPQQWIQATDAIGIVSKSGRYGGTYAHTDIAFEFASWISPEFKLYIIKDYQRLKKDEAGRLAIGWDAKRELSKINYRIHTDAVKEFLITPTLSPQEMAYTYASEADILNMALFGKTAAQWRNETGTSGKSPNIRDFASAEELVVLINLEDTNADLIRQKIPKIERLKILREKAYRQLELLKKNQGIISSLRKNLIEETDNAGKIERKDK
ncbi:KilA-N domain-containing protein [Clostridium sp. AN503]|uniref:KilA-N domain-containing protein n=1 Tax=Clostridium sp. AN503 TaxID=3160598 RepID=UPI0034584954